MLESYSETNNASSYLIRNRIADSATVPFMEQDEVRRLKEAWHRSGLSLKAYAKSIGMAQPTLWNWFNTDQSPTLRKLQVADRGMAKKAKKPKPESLEAIIAEMMPNERPGAAIVLKAFLATVRGLKNEDSDLSGDASNELRSSAGNELDQDRQPPDRADSVRGRSNKLPRRGR